MFDHTFAVFLIRKKENGEKLDITISKTWKHNFKNIFVKFENGKNQRNRVFLSQSL